MTLAVLWIEGYKENRLEAIRSKSETIHDPVENWNVHDGTIVTQVRTEVCQGSIMIQVRTGMCIIRDGEKYFGFGCFQGTL